MLRSPQRAPRERQDVARPGAVAIGSDCGSCERCLTSRSTRTPRRRRCAPSARRRLAWFVRHLPRPYMTDTYRQRADGLLATLRRLPSGALELSFSDVAEQMTLDASTWQVVHL